MKIQVKDSQELKKKAIKDKIIIASVFAVMLAPLFIGVAVVETKDNNKQQTQAQTEIKNNETLIQENKNTKPEQESQSITSKTNSNNTNTNNTNTQQTTPNSSTSTDQTDIYKKPTCSETLRESYKSSIVSSYQLQYNSKEYEASAYRSNLSSGVSGYTQSGYEQLVANNTSWLNNVVENNIVEANTKLSEYYTCQLITRNELNI